MRKPRTRLKDIAEATGYSANTVSLALRGSPRIPEETRDIIQAQARKLDYLPNTIAQALVSRQTKTIGLVLTDIMNPTLTLVGRSIERELSARGYSMMLAASDHIMEKELTALDVFRSRQVDGIMIYPCDHHDMDHIRAARAAGEAVLVLSDVPFAGVDIVAIDDRTGAYKAIAHLIERGHRKIAFVDAASLLGNTEKMDGARRAVTEAGLDTSMIVSVDPKGHSAMDGYRATAGLMEEPERPTAMFATTDSLALGALRWCRENGVSVPEDLAIVGYDNTELAEFGPVPMTTVNYAADDVSRHAVDRILSLIGQPVPPKPVITLIDPNLVVRQSS